jgi:hypothetical protein
MVFEMASVKAFGVISDDMLDLVVYCCRGPQIGLASFSCGSNLWG